MRCINYLSEYLVPVVLFYIVGFAVLQKRPVFDDFIEGALAGLKTVAGILPTLVGLMAAVGVLRTSGFLDFLSGVLAGPAAFLHIPAQVVPLLLVRLVSSSAATGLLLDIFKTYGPDSRLGMMVSVLESCTETGFLYDECLLSDRADLKDAMDACGGADCNVRGACGEYLM